MDMQPQEETRAETERRILRPCTWVWLILMALTMSAFIIGKMQLSGLAVVSFILASTFIKGQMVADHFMGLRRVRWVWRMIIAGWLTVVIGMIGFAYWLSLG